MGEYNNNKRVLFAEDVGSRKCGKQRSAAISISSISAAGWGLRFGHGFALGFKEAKCFAQCLISRVRVETRENKRYICQRSECPSLPAFCVEGEVPLDLDQATNRCGCTAIVLCGVRMKVPEKIFAHSFVEVSSVSYTHLRAHETPEHLVCRLLLEKKNIENQIWKARPHATQ